MWSGAGGAGGCAGTEAVVRRGRSAVLARGGVPAGCESPAFSVAELGAALDMLDARDTPCTIMVEREGSRLAARGGASAALAAAAARPAPRPAALTALLCALPPSPSAPPPPAGPPAAGWRLALYTAQPLAPLDELLVWPDAALSALAGVPPAPLALAPPHKRGEMAYVCEACGATFDQPNPLRMHVYLRCAPPAPRAFLRRLLRTLAAAPHPAPAPSTCSEGPARECGVGLGVGAGAALEALCAAWGARAGRGGGGGGHVCLYCGKTYSRRYGLKIHVRTHTGYRPLRCPHCARRFGDPSNLNKHVRLHRAAALNPPPAAAAPPGRGRYQCSRCGAGAARRRDLERHMRARHSTPSPSPSPVALAPAPAPG